MTPTMTRHTLVPTSLGELTLVASGQALTGVSFPGHWTRPNAQTFGPRVAVAGDAVLAAAGRQLREYLAGERVAFDQRRPMPAQESKIIHAAFRCPSGVFPTTYNARATWWFALPLPLASARH